MPVFAYRAIDGRGALVEGELDAGSRDLLVRQLKETGLLALDARPVRRPAAGGEAAGPGRRRRAKASDVTLFTRELAILLGAGQPLERALVTLSAGGPKDRLAALARRLVDEVRTGVSLSAAMAKEGPLFSPLYVSMVRAGESSGALETVLERLAELRERGERLRETVTSAMIYPIILVIVSLASVFLLLTFVVPQFETIFADAGAALPTPTRVVIATGKTLQSYGLFICAGLLVLVLGLRQALAMPAFRLRWDALMLRLPLWGGLQRDMITARFTRTFSTLIANGVDLPAALTLTREVMGNQAVTAAMEGVVSGVRQGRGLSDPLAELGVFAPLAIQMIKVGEETGRLDITAGHIADAYERKVEARVKRLVTLIEPSLIIILGLVVGGIVMSILLAVISINDLAF